MTSSTKVLNSTVTSNATSLPNSVVVQAFVNGSFVNVTLNQIEGIMNTAALSSKVYQMINSQIKLVQGANLVIFLFFE